MNILGLGDVKSPSADQRLGKLDHHGLVQVPWILLPLEVDVDVELVHEVQQPNKRAIYQRIIWMKM